MKFHCVRNGDTNNKSEENTAGVSVENTGTKWVCPVCGYIHYGEEPPATCPLCGVPGSMFKKEE